MRPLNYHAGQLAVQAEANTRGIADRLAQWHGPTMEYAAQADVIVLASAGADDALETTVLSGPPPLVEVVDESCLTFPASAGLRDGPCGGLVINFEFVRRARLNGVLKRRGERMELLAEESFTLCRKYIAPSVATGERPLLGPSRRERLAVTAPAVAELLAVTETAFLLSASPDGGPDVSHRGGRPGFITFDASTATLRWPEFLGDGVFKSAGNIRATGRLTLFVPDLDTGDGMEFVCEGAAYTNSRALRGERKDILVQHREAYPLQGEMVAEVLEVRRLIAVYPRRQRIAKALKVTSRATAAVQAPR